MPKLRSTHLGDVIERVLVLGGPPLTVLAAAGALWLLGVGDLIAALVAVLDKAASATVPLTINADPIYSLVGFAGGVVVGLTAGVLAYRTRPDPPA